MNYGIEGAADHFISFERLISKTTWFEGNRIDIEIRSISFERYDNIGNEL